jgi:hypothetical protein
MKKFVVLTCVFGAILSQTNAARAVGVGAAGTGAGVSVQTGVGGQGAAVNSGTANTGGSVSSSSSSGATRSGTVNNGTTVNGSGTAFAPGGTTVNPNFQVQQQPLAPAGTFAATNGGTPNYSATNQYNSSSNMWFTNQYAHTNGFNGTNGWALRNQFRQNRNTTFDRNQTRTFGSSSDRGFTEFDQTLIQRIRRVVFDPNAQLSSAGNGVSMTSQNGAVTVNGVVATPADAQLIVNNVQTVPGVVNVANRLVIDPNAANIYARSRAQNAQARTATGQRFLAPTSDPGLGNAVYSSNRNTAPSSTNIDTSVTGSSFGTGTVSNTTTTSSSSNP